MIELMPRDLILPSYAGETKLVLALNIGVVTSSLAFVCLQTGCPPRLVEVGRWSGQEDVEGLCTVPTVVLYDAAGKAVAYGADAIEQFEESEDGRLVRLGTIHDHAGGVSTVLPPNSTPLSVNTDFVVFLVQHLEHYYQHTMWPPSRPEWLPLLSAAEVVLTTRPTIQLDTLREAVLAALPWNFPAHRLSLMSEAEASVHFAFHQMEKENMSPEFPPGTTCLVLDAGRSEVDMTLLRCASRTGMQLILQTIIDTRSISAGSALVAKEFAHILQYELAHSEFSSPECLRKIVQVFEKKARFYEKSQNWSDDVAFRFGTPFDNDLTHGIRSGVLHMPADVMRKSFSRSISNIWTAMDELLQCAQHLGVCCDVSKLMVLLAGEFAESCYVRSVIEQFMHSKHPNLRLVYFAQPSSKVAVVGSCTWMVKQQSGLSST